MRNPHQTVCAALFCLLLSVISQAQELQPGELVVCSRTYGTVFGPVQVASGSEATSVLSGADLGVPDRPVRGSGPSLIAPNTHLSLLALSSDLILARPSLPTGWGMIAIDPRSGDRRLLPGTDTDVWFNGGDMILGSGGVILALADDFPIGLASNGRVLAYRVCTGETTVISGGLGTTSRGDGVVMHRPRSLALVDEYTAVVVEFGPASGGFTGVLLYRVDLRTGDRDVLSTLSTAATRRYVVSDGEFSSEPILIEPRGAGPRFNIVARGVAVLNGRIFVAGSMTNPFAPSIVEVDPITGDRTLLGGEAILEGERITVPFAPGSTDELPNSPAALLTRGDRELLLCATFGPNRIWSLDIDSRLLEIAADLDPAVLPEFKDDLLLSGLSIVPEDCVADCDGDGCLTVFDFLCFLNNFNDGSPRADCDGDGVLTLFDFLCFQTAFESGCP